MVFSSLVFLCIFLPIVFLGHTILPGIRAKNAMLLLASLVFYAYGEPVYVVLMIASALCNYLFALWIERFQDQKKWIVSVAVILNLALLVIFKYAGFLTESVNTMFGTGFPVPDIRLPIGISFFTFQAMSYVIDVYRGANKAQKNFGKVLLYISFFPQLIAGPIVKYHDVEQEIEHRTQSADGVARGIRRFIAGLSKKVLISNVMGMTADALFGAAAGTLGQRLHGWEHFPIYSRFILISAATAIWRSDLDGCSDFISRRISTILTVRPASGNSGEDGIFPCPAGFWNISIFRLAATEKAKCVPASINLSYFYVPVSGMEPT